MFKEDDQSSQQASSSAEEQGSIEALYGTRITNKRNPKSGEELKQAAISSLKALSEREKYFNVPKYLSVREVSKLTGQSLQMVRRHCIKGTYKGYQSSGTNGIWHIESQQFSKEPGWENFLLNREGNYKNAKNIAKLAIELLNAEEESE